MRYQGRDTGLRETIYSSLQCQRPPTITYNHKIRTGIGKAVYIYLMSAHAGSAADARFMCNPSRMGHGGTMLECVIVIVVKAESRVYIAPLRRPHGARELVL